MKGNVPPGIDAAGVERYFRENIPGGDAELEVSLLAGGRSNITYLVRAAGREWVLRRPPLGHVLPTAHDMGREFRVLSALAGTSVPVPRPLALCADAAVTGAPFYVMEYCRGYIIDEAMPEGYAATPSERHSLSLAVIRTLADLHSVDYHEVGLGSFGRPEGYMARQVERWKKQWESSKTREVPQIEVLVQQLRDKLPASGTPSIVHGDWRLGNLVLGVDDPGSVVGILDWEMSTLGDPLADIGWLLSSWGEADDPPALLELGRVSHLTTLPGFLTRREMVEEYALRTGRDVSRADYYLAFNYFKRAVVIEGIHARYLAGETVGEGFENFGHAPEFIGVGLELIEGVPAGG